MNNGYQKLYESYYTGKNRKAMYRCFCELIDAIRTNEFSAIKNICTEDCVAEFSTAGKFVGIDAIMNGLKWPGPYCQVKKSTIWNFVARSNKEGIGQQSAYVQNIMAIDDGVNVFPFIFGGQYCNSFVETSEGWKISYIRFDLVYSVGNTLFVKDKWFLIDPERYSGHDPIINVELDAPWYVIPDDCEPQSDAEQIFELQFKKTFGFDRGDFHLTLQAVTEDHCQFNLEKGNRIYNNFLKMKQHKESNLQHANRFGTLEINGNYAIAFMPRGEDHRLKDMVFTRDNIHSITTTEAHKVYAKKVNGEWKMYKIESGFYNTEYIPESDYFIPIDDSIIAYDEYVVSKYCNS